jgi:hypothetical protein
MYEDNTYTKNLKSFYQRKSLRTAKILELIYQWQEIKFNLYFMMNQILLQFSVTFKELLSGN